MNETTDMVNYSPIIIQESIIPVHVINSTVSDTPDIPQVTPDNGPQKKFTDTKTNSQNNSQHG